MLGARKYRFALCFRVLSNQYVERSAYANSLRRRANARNVSFRISLRWPIHIINPVDETKLSCYTSHRRSTTVSLETYPSKLNCTCFHWFPAAMLESLLHSVSILNTIIFSDTFCRITRVRNIAHIRNLGTLFIYCSSTIFQFLDSIY